MGEQEEGGEGWRDTITVTPFQLSCVLLYRPLTTVVNTRGNILKQVEENVTASLHKNNADWLHYTHFSKK